MSQAERKQKISSAHGLSVVKQCQLLSIPRSSAYYQPQAISDEDIKLMRLLDELHLKYPFYGSRRLRDPLSDEYGLNINRKRIQRLMRQMGIQAVYPKKNTSRANPAHKVYPYLLRGLDINRSNQVWAADITYLPMAKGFAYLIAIIDWHSRKVLAFNVSNVMDSDFCVQALKQAIRRYGQPEIFNTDQGRQFTSHDFTGELIKNGIQISMDGKGRWLDNVFIERLWRSVKYEEVYLHAYDSISQAKTQLDNYFQFYNTVRKHQTLKSKPDEVYYANLQSLNVAV